MPPTVGSRSPCTPKVKRRRFPAGVCYHHSRSCSARSSIVMRWMLWIPIPMMMMMTIRRIVIVEEEAVCSSMTRMKMRGRRTHKHTGGYFCCCCCCCCYYLFLLPSWLSPANVLYPESPSIELVAETTTRRIVAVVVDDTTPPVVLGDDNRHGESTLFLTLLLIKNKRVNFQDPVMTTIEIKDCGNVLM